MANSASAQLTVDLSQVNSDNRSSMVNLLTESIEYFNIWGVEDDVVETDIVVNLDELSNSDDPNNTWYIFKKTRDDFFKIVMKNMITMTPNKEFEAEITSAMTSLGYVIYDEIYKNKMFPKVEENLTKALIDTLKKHNYLLKDGEGYKYEVAPFDKGWSIEVLRLTENRDMSYDMYMPFMITMIRVMNEAFNVNNKFVFNEGTFFPTNVLYFLLRHFSDQLEIIPIKTLNLDLVFDYMKGGKSRKPITQLNPITKKSRKLQTRVMPIRKRNQSGGGFIAAGGFGEVWNFLNEQELIMFCQKIIPNCKNYQHNVSYLSGRQPQNGLSIFNDTVLKIIKNTADLNKENNSIKTIAKVLGNNIDNISDYTILKVINGDVLNNVTFTCPGGVYQRTRAVTVLAYKKCDGTLETFLEKETFTSSLMQDMLKNVIPLLDHFHKHNLYHGDIKEANVLYKKNGNSFQFFLSDYGDISADPCAYTLYYIHPSFVNANMYKNQVQPSIEAFIWNLPVSNRMSVMETYRRIVTSGKKRTNRERDYFAIGIMLIFIWSKLHKKGLLNNNDEFQKYMFRQTINFLEMKPFEIEAPPAPRVPTPVPQAPSPAQEEIDKFAKYDKQIDQREKVRLDLLNNLQAFKNMQPMPPMQPKQENAQGPKQANLGQFLRDQQAPPQQQQQQQRPTDINSAFWEFMKNNNIYVKPGFTKIVKATIINLSSYLYTSQQGGSTKTKKTVPPKTTLKPKKLSSKNK